MMAEHRYGRGKFTAHPRYIAYMEMIVNNPVYADMPNAVDDSGRINWQVSSGRTTSFYKSYEARKKWWEEKTSKLGTPKGNDETTIAARLIHPTGYRPCRLCGQDHNVGYFYLNQRLAQLLNRRLGTDQFYRAMPIGEALDLLDDDSLEFILTIFPERAEAFEKNGVSINAFETTNSLRSPWLSPGFMGDPPDRLDGFHDYCLDCREANDPGRAIENLRKYQHDRRAFMWWSEGDWALADALYNEAGAGKCSICGADVDPVSPDHVGPLACGFKQIPFFIPTCRACNSSKNRRMRASDVNMLVNWEEEHETSAASQHSRALWNMNKRNVASDEQASELSAHMRAFVDIYLRTLFELYEAGYARFIATLLGPQYAFFDHKFIGLDRSSLSFTEATSTSHLTENRRSLACRSIRIAFEELEAYAAKPVGDRRIRQYYDKFRGKIIRDLLEVASHIMLDETDERWNRTMKASIDFNKREVTIESLLDSLHEDDEKYDELRKRMHDVFNDLGSAVILFPESV